MSTSLPPVIDDYFRTSNKKRCADAAACFATDARVHDENQDHLGREAIHHWIEETTQKYQAQVEILRFLKAEDQFIVSGMASGNFPGSPIELEYTFTLSDEKISHLSIQ